MLLNYKLFEDNSPTNSHFWEFHLILIVTIASLLLFLFFFLFSENKQYSLLSPSTVAKFGNSEVLVSKTLSISGNIWLPALDKTLATNAKQPEITAKTAIVFDLANDSLIYQKNADVRLPIASTVKIMTAILALEQLQPSQRIKISAHAATVGEDFMGISENEVYLAEELLYGLLLPSGNDAAEAIAEEVAGNSYEFVNLMNQKAKLLGLEDTKFANPSGLDGDKEQYSTAYDLAVIARYAWVNFPTFQQIVGTKYYEIVYSQEHKYLYFENQTNLLSNYPGVKGIKPGYTPEAGLCLVTLAENGGHQILAVVLGSSDRRGDMTKLLDFSFAL